MQEVIKEMATEQLIKCRWMIRGDCEQVASITKHALLHRKPLSAREVQIALRQKTIVGAVAEMADDIPLILGFAMLSTQNDDICELVIMSVDHKWHRCGIGTMLLEHCERMARHIGYSKFHTIIHERELDAQMFFKAHGWQCKHIHRHYDGDDCGLYFYKGQ
jgi:GNAT superfamily N-acetyltransferase